MPGESVPVGSLTPSRFRRTAAADAPTRRGLTADECATVLATCLRPRRTGRGLERPKTAERRGLVDGAIVALLFHGALRRSEVASLHWLPTSTSATATTSWSPSAARRSTRPGVERTCDVWSTVAQTAVRSLRAAISPEPGDSVVGLSVDQINRRFAAACAAAGLEGRRTSHGGRVGLAVELTARGGLDVCHPARTPARRRRTSEHMVARSEAHDSGLCAADPATRRRFASDPGRSGCRRRTAAGSRPG